MARSYEESKMQIACIKWFDLQYSSISKCLFAVPNGGNRNPIEAKILRAEGVRAGASDLIFCFNKTTTFFELKTDTGTLSKSQKEFRDLMFSMGFDYIVIRDVDTFMKEINSIIKNSKN